MHLIKVPTVHFGWSLGWLWHQIFGRILRLMTSLLYKNMSKLVHRIWSLCFGMFQLKLARSQGPRVPMLRVETQFLTNAFQMKEGIVIVIDGKQKLSICEQIYVAFSYIPTFGATIEVNKNCTKFCKVYSLGFKAVLFLQCNFRSWIWNSLSLKCNFRDSNLK